MSDPAVVLSSRSVHDGRIVKLSLEEVRLPNGNTVTLELIRHPGAAAVVPVDQDGNVILVRQYRHATGSWLLEIPAGKLDHPGESSEACARREVEEETGYRAGRLVPWVGSGRRPGSPTRRSGSISRWSLTPTRSDLQPDEVLTVEKLPLEEAARRAITAIVDGKSVCALLRARPRAFPGIGGSFPSDGRQLESHHFEAAVVVARKRASVRVGGSRETLCGRSASQAVAVDPHSRIESWGVNAETLRTVMTPASNTRLPTRNGFAT
jgi:ADP-ribose pyrophosphatase